MKEEGKTVKVGNVLKGFGFELHLPLANRTESPYASQLQLTDLHHLTPT